MRTVPGSAVTLFVLGLVAGGPVSAAAQDPGSRERPVAVDSGSVEVRLVDGSTLYGRVESETEDVVRLVLLSGDTIELRHERIEWIRPLEGKVMNGQVWRPDPNVTRLFFGPTGRSLPAGSGYFSVYELVIPFLAFGITDRFTLAGGTPLIFGGGDRIFWFAPKFQVVRDERANVGVGVLHFLAANESNVGIAYAVGTIGDPDGAITGGIGIPYASGDLADAPVFMVGGESRISRSVKLISENYFFPGDGFGLLGAGPRFFGEKLTADVGLAIPVGVEEFFAFPLVSFVYNW